MPFDPEILSPSEWLQAGAIGVLALTFILVTIAFLWYVGRRDAHLQKRDAAWRTFLKRTNDNFMAFLNVERDRREEAMDHGLDDVQELSAAVANLANAMGSHDNNAVSRHTEIVKAQTEIKTILLTQQTFNKETRR